ncbi:MAG: hydantoinase/oxoprolinase family protein [Lachnospiraceae bacterium]|nr:hydantoinase/oxoprolinase family protein [Lachnospiraceae bacterium]
MEYYIAVDSGGTFSDCVVISGEGKMWTGKSPSTPPCYEKGIVNSVYDAAESMGMTGDELFSKCALFSHGTTVATNALLTREGCKAALITTKGHEDAIIIGRIHQKIAGKNSAEVSDMSLHDKAEPIIPKKYIYGITERMDYKGEEVVKLSLSELDEIAEKMLAEKIEAVAVSLLWSFKNPAHEIAIAEYLKKKMPGVFISISSELSPVIGEYERTATTAINAFLSKKVENYLSQLGAALQNAGYKGEPLVMKSSGGITSISQAMDTSVSLLMSGPAGGVNGTLALSKMLNHKNVLTADVGGTSFDVGMIVGGEIMLAEEPVFDQYNVTYPMVNVVSIGAGGGSIAWIEEGTGLLKVGPKSAGALPGPVCYGKGGTLPTVTDANLVLGRMNPQYFLGGKFKLDAEGSRKSIEPLAEKLGISVEETALGIVEIADAHMGDLVRKMTVQRGYDPRTFALYAFGGAGPLHACGFTRGTGIDEMVIPKVSSVFSAFGIAQSDLNAVAEESITLAFPVEPALLAQKFALLKERAGKEILASGKAKDEITYKQEIMVRYNGQKHVIPVVIPYEIKTEEDVSRICDMFEAEYEKMYGKGTSFRKAGISLTGLRVRALGGLGLPALNLVNDERGEGKEPNYETVYLRETGGWTDVPFYKFDDLPKNFDRQGPAIIISNNTTIYVAPDFTVALDEMDNLILHPCK